MSVCSKYYYNEQGKDYREGGWFEGDFHVWVRNKKTGEIIDPCFKEHETMCSMNRLDINKPVYRPWNNQKRWLDESLVKYNSCIQHIVKSFAVPQYRCCSQNAFAWIHSKPERLQTHSLVIGSMGWKNKYEPGYWFEWG